MIKVVLKNCTSHSTMEWNLLKCLQTKILYSAKISFKSEEQILSDKQKLREYIVSRPAVQEMLKEVL